MENQNKTLGMLEVARQAVELAKQKGANEAAATGTRAREVQVQWRDGKLEKVSEATTRNLAIQLYANGRFSSVSTSDLRPEALATFITDALALTKTLAEDPHRRLPEPELYQGRSTADLSLVDPTYETLTPDARKNFASAMEAAARSADKKQAILSVTSGFSDTLSELHRVASNGFEGSTRSTSFVSSAEVSVKDADGRRPEEYEYAMARRLSDLPDPAALGKAAAERALSRLGTKKPPSAVLTMVVENRVGGRMANMLGGPMSASAIQQKRSFLEGKVGTKLGSAMLDVSDDPLLPRGLASRPFDSEGLTAAPRKLFEDGVLRALYVDTYYGRKLGLPATTGMPSNLTWKLGSKDLTKLLAQVKEGIFVTSFLGGNSNAATGDFSLGVQGFRIRKGALAEPVGEINIAGNQLELWKRLTAVGNDPFLFSTTRTPTFVFEGVQFAGV